MAKFTAYTVLTLPSSGIDVNGLYFVQETAGRFVAYVRKADNSSWMQMGITNDVESVNGLDGTVQLNLSLSGAGVLTITGGATSIDLDARYTKNVDSINWSRINGSPTTVGGYGITDAVKNVGNETVAGVKTFSSSPVVPTPASSTDAANKSYVDAADSGLQTQINNLSASVAEGIKTPDDIDCSTNPNYPASTKGDSYKVTVAGKIGGALGKDVDSGDLIVCKTTNGGGTDGDVGANFYIVEGNLMQATEGAKGTAKIATQAATNTGTDDTTIVTPKKLQVKLDAERGTSDGKYVRTDAAQGLNNTQKTQARANTGAADDAAVLHLAGAETVSGAKTFSVAVTAASTPTADTHLANKQYVDNKITTETAWGTREW